MEEGKEKTLGKLYALRAGMSFIALKRAQVKESHDTYHAYDYVTERRGNWGISSEKALDRYNEISRIKSLQQKALRVVEKDQKDIKDQNIDILNKEYEIKKSKSKIKLNIALIGLVVLFVFLLIIAVGSKTTLGGVFGVIGFYILLPVAIIGFFSGVINLIHEKKSIKENMSRKDSFENRQAEAKRSYEMHSKDVERFNKALAEFRDEQSALKDQYDTIKAQALEITFPVYNALKKLTASLITERDWGNLDLVIYYFETGRAETIKEALQLVDRQKQTDAIIYAIEQVGNKISNMISTATVALMKTIKYACDEIVDNIRAVNANLSELTHKVNVISDKTDMLASTAMLQNALLSQANRNSAELAKDVSYMLEEYNFAKRN